ncbi:DUF4917 family protein [Mesorhizobium sp. M0019]|uniref:DUF4917 family protein n=1 Tax=Mesorhizobium sp. M0019 TaxID=2956845 RepID=UPI003335D543
MPNIISFEEALGRTKEKDRSLLIGNGFSIEYFSYRTLVEKAGLGNTDPMRKLFAVLDTFDFESVIRALEDAALVETAYGDNAKAATFRSDANRLREALVHAVRVTHPAHREDIAGRIPSCVQFLKNFSKLFSMNYDLLLYWVQLDLSRDFKDGFGLGDEHGGFRGPFKEAAHCNIYNLHGGLHLFKTTEGDVEKRLMGPSGVIDAIAQTITAEKRLPIYVAEGTSSRKLAKINSLPYLRHCYEQLKSSSGMFFVYGHSADQNDEHIYRALFSSGIEHLYFCLHKPTADVTALDGELALYKHQSASGVDYTFVDSETAQVWNRAV